MTTLGYMGLCPMIAEEGDLICLLFGGATPYILRPKRNYFQFLGACYLHGRMDGSAIENQRIHHVPSELFDLR